MGPYHKGRAYHGVKFHQFRNSAQVSQTGQKLQKQGVKLGAFCPCQDFAGEFRIWQTQNQNNNN
jgi:hypothetical protein